jgi:DNA-binding MarR family transcriptional regulator
MDTPEDFQRQLAKFILLINEKIMKQMATVRKGRLTTSQFYAVATVKDGGRMTMSALAGRMDISRQQATKTVNQLVDAGYLRRIPQPSDRRLIQIDLTDEAHRFMDEFMAECTRVLGAKFVLLKAREQKELRSAIEALNRLLERM